MPERRYGEEEVGLILKRAAEAGVRSEGLTLAQLREVAAEAGLDPDAVESEARTLDVRTSLHENPLVGGAVAPQFEQLVRVPLGDGDFSEIQLAIRRAMGRQGRTAAELDGLEWSARDAFGGRYVSVRPSGDGTLVRVLGNFRDGAFGLFLGGGTMTSMIALAVLKKTGLLATLGFGGGALVVLAGLLSARWAWKWFARKEERVLRATLASVVRTLEDRDASRALPRPEPTPD